MKAIHFPLLLYIILVLISFMSTNFFKSQAVQFFISQCQLENVWLIQCCVWLQIMFDNNAHSGKIKISLSSHVQINVCKDWNVSGSSKLICDTGPFTTNTSSQQNQRSSSHTSLWSSLNRTLHKYTVAPKYLDTLDRFKKCMNDWTLKMKPSDQSANNTQKEVS